MRRSRPARARSSPAPTTAVRLPWRIPIAASSGRPRTAIADYGDAIKSDPQQSAAYNNRGIAYPAASDYEKAIADYDKAVELNPTYASALNNRGLAYFNGG